MTEPPVFGVMFAWRLIEKLEHFIKREVISTKLNKMQNLLNGYIWVKKTLGLYEWISFINKIVTRLESHTISPDVLDTELIIPFIRLLCSQYLRGNQWDRFKWEMKKLNTLLVSDSQISWHSISDTVKGYISDTIPKKVLYPSWHVRGQTLNITNDVDTTYKTGTSRESGSIHFWRMGTDRFQT